MQLNDKSAVSPRWHQATRGGRTWFLCWLSQRPHQWLAHSSTDLDYSLSWHSADHWRPPSPCHNTQAPSQQHVKAHRSLNTPAHTHTHTHTQPFNGRWSGTTRVGWYKKKHSPTHTHPDHRTSFINFLHLLRSTASSLFSLYARQPLSRSSLVLDTLHHTPCISSPNHHLLFAACSAVIPMPCHLYPVSLSLSSLLGNLSFSFTTDPTWPNHNLNACMHFCMHTHCFNTSSHIPFLGTLPHINQNWLYLSGTGLPRFSWKRTLNGCSVAVAAIFQVNLSTIYLSIARP